MARRAASVTAALLALLGGACSQATRPADAGDPHDGEAGADGDVDDGPRCEPATTDEVDIVVVWADTHYGPILAEQVMPALASLRDALPADASVHVGVLSTDLGRVPHDENERCVVGHDGVLLPCWSSGQSFAEGGPEVVTEHLECVMVVAPDDGCGFHRYFDALTRGLVEQAAPGGPNAGFLRPGSVLLIMFLGYRDDCSTDDPAILDVRDDTLGSPCIRCEFNQARLVPVESVVDALRALRPGCPERVVAGGFLGVPVGWDGDLGDPALVARLRSESSVCELVRVCEETGAWVWSEPTPRLATLCLELGAVGCLGSLCGRGREALMQRVGERIAELLER